MAKKIQKIKIAASSYELEDATATHSINGYEKAAIEGQTVTFANSAITTAEINKLFTAANNGGND